MNTLTAQDKDTSLEVIGLSMLEEQIYGVLLDHPGATEHDVAHELKLGSSKIQRVLHSLEIKGLATHSPERPRRYLPTSPDIALETLILKRHEELQQARSAILRLQKRADIARTNDAGREQMIEIVTSHVAERQVFEQMVLAPLHEVICLERPPLRMSSLVEPDAPERQGLAKGVRYRSIADQELLMMPDAIDRIRGDINAGEEVRVLPSLPFKMVVADRRIGIIPLDLQQQSGPVLLVRASALLDALYMLFDLLWERATPIHFSKSGSIEVSQRSSSLSAEAERLIPLLVAGLADKATAHVSGIPMRTLNRRIAELMKELNASTRFQAGWLSALRLTSNSSSKRYVRDATP